MDLPTLQIIPFFLHRNELVHVGTEMDSPAPTACWPTAIVAGGKYNNDLAANLLQNPTVKQF